MSEKVDFIRNLWADVDRIPGYLIRGQEHWLHTVVDSLPDDAVIVEIGSFLGRSATAMAFACVGTNKKIYCIDTFQGNDSDFVKGQSNVTWEGEEFLTQFKKNLDSNNLLEYVVPVPGLSYEIGENWDKEIDFLFIDGSHEYEDVIRDFDVFSPYVKAGSIIAFHDVLPNWEGPYKAWKNHIQEKLHDPSHFFSIAYGRRKISEDDFQGTVHAIIPVHNRIGSTGQCIKSIYSQTCIDNISITVVNDGSTDGTTAILAEEYPQVKVIEGDGDLWWTGAVKKALDDLRGSFKKGDYFLLINNDVRLSPETIEMLLMDSMAKNRACIAPLAVTEDGATSAGWGPGMAPILMNFERQYKKVMGSQHILEVHAIYGRCSLFPVEIMDVVGNYDAETFPHYWGDTDYCLRARKKGVQFFISGRTTIRVIENKDTTGFQHEFRKGPQDLAVVYEAMTSIRSIDNLKHIYTYMERHHPSRKWRNVIYTFFKLMKQYRPIYHSYYTFRRIFGLDKNIVRK